MSKQFCVTPECDEAIKPGSSKEHCVNCRASMNMWARRGIRAILERRSRLRKYDSRMEHVSKPKSVAAAPAKKAMKS